MKVLIGQINPKVGDISGNLRMIRASMGVARDRGVDLVVFPEMAVCGYPPRDMLLREAFVRRCELALDELVEIVSQTGIAAIVGTISRNCGSGPPLFNSAVVINPDCPVSWCYKRFLPTYDIFDERRYFVAGVAPCVVEICGCRVGVTICEDMWGGESVNMVPTVHQRRYIGDPVVEVVTAGADMVVNISASPFSVGKQDIRESIMRSHVDSLDVPFIYANQVGANDELVFDGGSLVMLPGERVSRAPAFLTCDFVVDIAQLGCADGSRGYVPPDTVEAVWDALALGTQDYYRKSGIFSGTVVGLSGGIDSAVTAAIARDALGSALVTGVAMPSRHSSDHSLEDAHLLADNLHIDYRVIPIAGKVEAAETALSPLFGVEPPPEGDVSAENIQARARGDVLMALSNRFGWLVLTTGNKSELAVGYCTLYGDMCGGLAVLSDVPKTLVYELAEYANRKVGYDLIPRRTIEKPPSAELKPNQEDSDTLPPYPVLDAILEEYVERGTPPDEIGTQDPADRHWVSRIVSMVDRNEYKRRQAAPGLRVTSRAFGNGWRMPIVGSHSW